MSFYHNGEPIDADLYSLYYGADHIANGVLVDTETFYKHLLDSEADDRQVIDYLMDQPMEHWNLEGEEIDWEAVPHSWVMKSIEKAIVRTAEQACVEAVEEA